MRLWAESIQAAGTVIETYLRFRGYKGAIPGVLRYLPCHKHTPSGIECPVQASLVVDATGQGIGLHRTYVRHDGQGKINHDRAKMSLGPIRGGAVRLAEAADQVILCEGIETGLALLQDTGLPVWACLSAGGLKAVQLPDAIRTAIIGADYDPVGLEAAEEAAQRFYYEGRAVKVIRPKQPGTDFADQIFKMGK